MRLSKYGLSLRRSVFHQQQFVELGLYNQLAVALPAVGFKVILVVGLGGPEGFQGENLSDRQVLVGSGIDEVFQGYLGEFFLVLVGVKDDGSVLGSDIIALTVDGCGIVGTPEDFQDGSR